VWRLAHGHGAQDKETLEKFIKRSYDMTLETRELSTKGWNWGDIDVVGASPSGIRMAMLPRP